MISILNANALNIPLADKSVHMVVTSPPYWGLRDYGTATFIGGDENCDHKVGRFEYPVSNKQFSNNGSAGHQARAVCPKCGAERVDNQLGLERIPDCLGWATGNPCGECYVCHTVQWAREVKRVLRDDGTFWLNIGDSYVSNPGDRNKVGGIEGKASEAKKLAGACMSQNKHGVGLKPKDLCMIPARVALALQADGWYLRSDIIWSKPNPMPESITDRPTKAHEYMFLLSKSKMYYYDNEAIKEKAAMNRWGGNKQSDPKNRKGDFKGLSRDRDMMPTTRNRRSVWHITTAPYRGAHFATYPPKLVEPCIKAGTSEHGVCPKCGAQWTRVIDKIAPGKHESEYQTVALGRGSHADKSKHATPSITTTVGWRPSCICGFDPVPAIVFDPFAGSGTTLLVAYELNRRAVGTDLSFTYLSECAQKRLGLFLYG